jgi:hypothetical protein
VISFFQSITGAEVGKNRPHQKAGVFIRKKNSKRGNEKEMKNKVWHLVTLEKSSQQNNYILVFMKNL